MVIEKVFGLSATSVSLNDRFTLLSAAATVNTAVNTQFRSTPAHSTPAYTGRLISDNEEFQPNIKQRLRSRMNIGTLKQQQAWQYNLIKRALLRGTLGQTSVKNRLGLKRGITRGIRNRWNRGNLLQAQRAQRLQFARRSRPFNTQRTRGRGRPRVQGAGFANQQNGVKQTAHRGRPFRGGGRGRGRGRGGITRQQSQPSKEQLDAELEQYMSCTKSALDKQLDEYMQDALMDFTTPE